MINMRRIAIVTPWFGMNIPGGAEAEARELALHFADSGWDVEILTTCVKSFTSRRKNNYYREKQYYEGGLTVRRYKIDKINKKEFNIINRKLMNGLEISHEEEEVFLRNNICSSNMLRYIKENSKNYSFFIFIPYLFGTTYYGCQICPEKSVLIPCFHDESYFYLQSFKEAFSKVRGIVFNSTEEQKLTVNNYHLPDTVKQIVMGIGMDTEQQQDANRFRDKYKISSPFILYAGRKDKGKNTDTLLQYFSEFKFRNNYSDLKLVLLGGGDIHIPASVKNSVIDLGFVSVQDKFDAYAAASVLCQPSKHESFSYVIMESWIAGRPVIVADQCAVTKSFCRESGGGLWFRDYYEFEGALLYILENPRSAKIIGQNGKKYVEKSFSWEVVLDKYNQFFDEIDTGR